MKRILIFGLGLAAMLAAAPSSAQLVKVDPSANSGTWIYAHGLAFGPKDGTATLVDATHPLPVTSSGGATGATSTAAAPTLVEGATNQPLSLDLSGRLRTLDTITGTLPAFASTPTFNLGTLNGAALDTTLSAQSAKLPASLGAKTGANSFSVVPNSDTPFPVSVANGSNIALGNTGDGVYAGSGAATLIGISKGIYAGLVAPTPAGTNNIGGVNIDNVADGVVRSDTVSSATSSLTISTVGYGAITFQGIANASANTVVFEGSNDGGTTWSIVAFRSITAATSINVTSIPITAGSAYIPVTMMPLMRWRIFTYVSGSTTIAIGLKRSVPTVGVDAAISSLPSLPAGGNNIGVVNPTLGTGAGAGTPLMTSYILSSAATTNSNLISTGIHRMISGQICNNNATIKQYVKFYNKATAPTVGTDTPLDTFTLQPNSCLALQPMVGDFGQHFSLGLGVGITGAFATSDTTAVAAGDVTLNVLYL